MRLHMARGTDVSLWIKSIFCTGYALAIDEARHDLVDLIARAGNINRLVILGNATTSMVSVTSRVSCATLQELDIDLDPNSEHDMVYISQLFALRILDVGVHGGESVKIHPGAVPWDLPLLYSMRWWMESGIVASHLIAFLETCNLPSLRIFHHDVTLGENDLPPLLRVISKFTPMDIIGLRLEEHQYEDVVPFVTAAQLRLEPVTAAALEYLPNQVSTLRLRCNEKVDTHDGLWKILDALRVNPRHITAVYILGWDDTFAWFQPIDDDKVDIEVTQPQMYVGLVRHAIALARLGIRMVDVHQQTLSEALDSTSRRL
jgi:hypothetical protein